MVDGEPGQLQWLAAVGALLLLLVPQPMADFWMTQDASGEIIPAAVSAMTFSGLGQRLVGFGGHGAG
jgi:hypothetical protein